MYLLFYFFFFQAEDGIRDHCVTGVQTCALPIFGAERARALGMRGDRDCPAPPAVGARAARLVEDIPPGIGPGVRAARERLPLVAGGEADRAVELCGRPRAERLGVVACDLGGRVVGQLRIEELGPE